VTNHQIVEKYKRDNPKRDVAVVALRDKDGRVFLVRTHRLKDWWQPVGGGVDPEDASPLMAAARETKEELGVTLDPAKLHLVITAPYDFGEGTVYFFEVFVDAESLAMTIDAKEIIDNRWFALDECLALPTFDATGQFLKRLNDERAK